MMPQVIYTARLMDLYLVNDRFGNPNSAYSFNGTSNYISIPDGNALDFGTGDYTVSFWFKTNSASSPVCILSKLVSSGYPYYGVLCF